MKPGREPNRRLVPAGRKGRVAARRNATQPILLRGAFGLVALAVLTACSGTSSPPTASVTGGSAGAAGAGGSFLPAQLKGPAPSSIKISTTGNFLISELPTLVAAGPLGYFAAVENRFHTTISFDNYATTPATEAALVGGTDQFNLNGAANFISPVLKGQDQYGIFNESIGLGVQAAASVKYKSSRGSKLAEFNQSPWCAVAAGPSSPVNTALALAAAEGGLKISNLNVQYLGSTAAIIPGLQSGRCQLAGSNSATLGPAMMANLAYPVLNLGGAPETIETMGAELGTGTLNTTHKFTDQYPALTQAIVDAELKGLLFVQQNYQNANTLWKELPSIYTSTTSLAAFMQSLNLEGTSFIPKYNNGSYSVPAVNDTLWVAAGQGVIPLSDSNVPDIAPNKLYSNVFVNQAYKDLKVSPTANTVTGPGSAAGPTDLPSTVGEPSLQAAKAYATLSGKPIPANTGPSQLGLAATNSTS